MLNITSHQPLCRIKIMFPQTLRYDSEQQCVLFFPRMESLSAMFKTGLYINDLSMHDSSRDLVLAGTQQSEELKRALIQVRHAPESCGMFSA